MTFKGLFVGVDRYASGDINQLSCAKRDAVALHALFTDSLGGRSQLLVDEQATRSTIMQALQELGGCDPEDVVVITFSGHGTRTHELVTHETSLDNIVGTTISLDQLIELFRRIPARRLLLVLDCCFSGGMGARVLTVAAVSRDVLSVEAKLEQLKGEGRVILTASGPTQQAYEDPRRGHGYLTMHLLEGLQGPEELRKSDRIGVLPLLDWVTKRVTDSTRQLGRLQAPTIRGTFDGELVWPVFVPGERFRSAFPEKSRSKATSDIRSLAAFGFPPELLTAWAGEIPTLNDLQLDAINEYGVLNGDSIVASAPTSSGKTMLGELAGLKGALERRRTLFLLPLKALVADKMRHFTRLYKSFGIRTIEATGETDDLTPLVRGQYDIALLTYEKFAMVALTQPHVLDQISTIVVDELQMISDPTRGAGLEFTLTLLGMRRRRGFEHQVIALSAVIGETNGLERWLGARLLRRNERPVPLDEGVLRSDGAFRFIDGDSLKERTVSLVRPLFGDGKNRDWVIPLVKRLINENKKVIVFRETTGETRHAAKYLADSLGLPPSRTALAELVNGDPSLATQDLRDVLTHGVAFHNAHLTRLERQVIEEGFRAHDDELRVIVATTTLAMGVNTPASAVVIVGLEHPGGQPYSVAEYKNLVGRAGRLGYAERGASFLIATDARAEHEYWRQYVMKSPEALVSQLGGSDPRTLIVRALVASERTGGLAREEIVEFLQASFAAFQAGSTSSGWKRVELEQALVDLISHRLVEQVEGGKFIVAPLGRLAGESGTEVESVLRVIECLQGLDQATITDPVLLTAAQVTVELDSVYFPINKRSTQKEPQTWQSELQRQAVPNAVINVLHRRVTAPAQAVSRAKRAVACLYYIAGTEMQDIERTMSQFGGAFGPIAGSIRGVTGRTCDVLPMVCRVAELLHSGLDLGQRQQRLVVRLEYGVHAAAVDLARYTGNALDRGDYRKLMAAGLSHPDSIARAVNGTLLELLGRDVSKLASVRSAVTMHELQAQRQQNAVQLPAYQG